MRSPTLAIVTVAVLTTVLVNASPLPEPGSYNSHVYAVSSPDSAPSSAPSPRLHPIIGTKVARDAAPDHSPSIFAISKIGPRELLKRALDAFTTGGNAYSGSTGTVSGGSVANKGGSAKREDDESTLGGNAYTGSAGDVSGGDVVNKSDNFGMPTLMNMNSNNAGLGGGSESGCANGGHGDPSRGAGGNSYSGTAGKAEGGSVWNSGGVMNVDSNNAGAAGLSKTGCATGGDVSSLNSPTA
ncbi:hypothetical protein K466DRAFT_585967 [Polyporus arcularius HHB13444]|uniref:Uncharacterized protein n=1 Tax=Polyporus arcularius HHB13444 TaxID=1314778 RepID=A0A5C3PFF8_9APHY|nr:hypothetical protein K466DRAFT_585967 [Polyporus arcularius HHB13444]